jgi:hypothetical protein
VRGLATFSSHGTAFTESQTARSALAVFGWFGSVDAEGLLETTPSQGGDDHGVATPHPFDPAEIEKTLGNSGPERTRDMWAPLGPIEAETAHGRTNRTPRRKRDPELVEKTGTRGRDYGGFVVDDDEFAGDQSVGEIDAEAAGKVVVTDSGRIDRACLGDIGLNLGLFSRATATIPSIISATFGVASRKYRCRPLRSIASTPAFVSFPRCVLAV